jgi:hypothetical protein
MDMSKLPRLSQSDAPPPDEAPGLSDEPRMRSAVVATSNETPPRLGSGAEAWISIGIGLLVLFMSPNTLKYVASKISHSPLELFPDPTRPFPAKCDFILYEDGTKIFYRNMPVFWSDVVVTAFALILILDGLVLVWARRAKTVLIAFGITALATAANGIYLFTTIQSGLPIISAFAVLFGVYIAIAQWGYYKALTAFEAASGNNLRA